MIFFFSSRRRHTRLQGDWSSDVCSSDLSLEGRNFKVLVEDINTNAYDLVIMGALGVGAVKDSVIGGVTERVVRRVRASDIFVIKNTLPMNGGSILVALDGSHFSFGGLKTALALRQALNQTGEAGFTLRPH